MECKDTKARGKTRRKGENKFFKRKLTVRFPNQRHKKPICPRRFIIFPQNSGS